MRASVRSRVRASWRAALLVAALAAGCDAKPYCIDNCGEGGLDVSRIDVQPVEITTVPIDARAPDACVPTGPDLCDGRDNDCNGVTDEADPMLGVACGNSRAPCRGGTIRCTNGTLVCGGDVVLPMPEICDGVDNDCDGQTDNGDPGGGQMCGMGVGECRRGVTGCRDGRIACVGERVPMAETCNGLDDNCNGEIDEGNPGGGMPCGSGIGACALGVVRCTGGTLRCVGAGTPTPEACDNIDNDCNGLTDETFDLQTDARNCGQCGMRCDLANAVDRCERGECTVRACRTGWVDLDGRAANGCEYRCDFRGAEVCNALDDDCDGMTDELLTPPSICAVLGECQNTVARCQGSSGWVCPYAATVSKDTMGRIVPEIDCDGRDNDCNGRTDDAFPDRGGACTRGLGQCVSRGTFVCNATSNGLRCEASDPPVGTAEVCNGLDDDCDGMTDEDAPDAWVTITGAFGARQIYAYEASRPDATATEAGSVEARSCSAPGRIPWTNVTYAQATAACTAAGARLCTEQEWQTACETPRVPTCAYSFAANCAAYQPDTCNGVDRDNDPLRPGAQHALLATGALTACYADWGSALARVYDLSGNVREWTQARANGLLPVRGGTFNNIAGGLACANDFVVTDATFQFNNVGFRCCR